MKKKLSFLLFLLSTALIAGTPFNSDIDLKSGAKITTSDINRDIALEPSGTGSVVVRSGKNLRLNSSGNTNYGDLILAALTGNRVYTFPDASMNVVGHDTAQTLTNKNLASSTNTITGATAASFSNGGTVTLPSGARTLVARDTADTLTNKDFDGGTASNSNRLTVPKNTKTTLDGLTRKEGTVVYSTDQAKLFVDNGSTLTPVGSGSGSSGEVNAVINPNAATDLTGYADSDAGSDVTRDTTAANLALYPTIETGVKVNADAASEYISYCGAMPAGLKNRKLKLEWFQVPESGYATGDQKLEVYSTTSSTCDSSLTRLALSTDASSVTAIPNATGKFTTTADTNSDGYFQIRWVRVSGTKALTLQNIIYGPGIQPQGAVVTEWQSYTPTVTNLPTSITTARYRRVGSSVEIMANATASGAATGEIRISLPTGLTINTSAITAQDASTIFGHAEARTSGGSAYHDGNVIWLSTTAVRIVANGGSGYTWDATRPFTWANGYVLTIKFTVPIAEWAGSGTLNVISSGGDFASNSNSTNTSSDTTSFAYGPAGSNMPNGSVGTAYVRRVRLPRNIQADERVIVETNLGSSSNIWVDAQSRFPNVYQGASLYGVEIVGVSGSTTDVDVYFNAQGYAPTNATYAGNGSPWSSITSWKWRVRIVKNAEAVGFGAATATQSGLVNPYNTSDGGVVNAGTYTPTITGVANVAASTAFVTQYMRVGPVVTVAGRVDIDPTSATTGTRFGISLPIASALTQSYQAGGTCAADSSATAIAGRIYADETNDRVTCDYITNSDTGNRSVQFTFTYLIL